MILGIDEAGCGPSMGPISVAAVVIKKDIVDDVRDSKLIAEKKRFRLAEQIKQKADFWCVSMRDNKIIDKVGLEQAWARCIQGCLNKAKKAGYGYAHVILDGDHIPKGMKGITAVVKADQKYYEVSCASIIAKTTRDALIIKYDKEFPAYDWAQNKGYPVPAHIKAIQEHGYTKYHRSSFKLTQPASRALKDESMPYNKEQAVQMLNDLKDIGKDEKAGDVERSFVYEMRMKVRAGDDLSPRMMYFLNSVHGRVRKKK